MNELRKIYTIEDFVYDQFLFLNEVSELIKKDKEDKEKLQEAYNDAFATILSVGYPCQLVNDIIEINGECIGLNDYSYKIEIQSIISLDENMKDIIESIKNNKFSFKTNAEIQAETEAKIDVNSETVKTEIDIQAAQSVEESTDDSANKITITQNSLFTEESETETSKYAYNLDDEPEELAETQDFKYLDTMWLFKHHVICENKNQSKGVNRQEFDIILIPVEIPLANRKKFPIKHIAVIYSCSEHRYAFEMPDERKLSGVIAFDDYEFMHTVRFDANGQIVTTINIKQDSKYAIVENDDSIIHQQGTYVPKHFGKYIEFENESVELFPLYDTNNETRGVVSTLYIHNQPNGEKLIAIDEDYVLLPLENGKFNKQIALYWGDINGKPVLNAQIG